MKIVGCIATIALLAAPVLAQDVSAGRSVPPNPADIAVPDLGFTPTKRDPNHYWEYFAFHKRGVTYPTAFTDLTECADNSRYLVATGPVPDFVALSGDEGLIVRDGPPPYSSGVYSPGTLPNMVEGLIAPIIFAIATSSVNHGVERANTRRCMAYKGYKRYGLTSAIWNKISNGKDTEIAARLALIASAPTPPAEEIDP